MWDARQDCIPTPVAGVFPMRRITAVAAALLSAFPALAQDDDDVMAASYGNTVIIRELLATWNVWYDADHRFTAFNRLVTARGRWEIEGGQLCMYYDTKPLFRPNPECGPVAAHSIGEKWNQNGRSFEMREGRDWSG